MPSSRTRILLTLARGRCRRHDWRCSRLAGPVHQHCAGACKHVLNGLGHHHHEPHVGTRLVHQHGARRPGHQPDHGHQRRDARPALRDPIGRDQHRLEGSPRPARPDHQGPASRRAPMRHTLRMERSCTRATSTRRPDCSSGMPRPAPTPTTGISWRRTGEVLCFHVSLPLATPDAFQLATTTATFTFDAEQTKNN